MPPRSANPSYPRSPRGSRFIAWIALLFSFLALLISSFTFLAVYRNGELLGDFQAWLKNANQALHSRSRKAPAPAEIPYVSAAPSAEPPSALQVQWDRFCAKLGQAEAMIRDQDGHAREYLAGLKDDLEAMRDKGAANGGQWLDQAAAKLKSIREQVAVDGPAAARRLRELSGEIRQYAQTLHRVNEALRPAPTPEFPAPAPAPAEATPTPEEPRP